MKKPKTTLFMLMSVDGKISTGETDNLDVDKDFPKIKGIKEGLNQYYELEKYTDLFSLNSGKVLAKIGINDIKDNIFKLPVTFIVIDNKPHLTNIGIDNLLKKSKKLIIITTNKLHPAFDYKNKDLEIIFYENEINFKDLFKKLHENFGVDNLTIQTGGELNSVLLRNNLIDKISIVVAPVLIGGKNTPTLIDGKSLKIEEELINIKALKLEKVDILENSYINLKYDLINDTKIN